MSARFLVLFPFEPAGIVRAAHVVEMLAQAIDDPWIGCLIVEKQEYLLNGLVVPDTIFTFDKTPGERKRELLEQVPDYLIDLSEDGKFWLFRNRLRVIDFSLSAKRIRRYKKESTFDASLEQYQIEIIELLKVFDLQQVERKYWWHPNREDWTNKHLPDSFQDGFLGLDLDAFEDHSEVSDEELASFLSILEYNTLLIGSAKQKERGDRLMNQVGCSLFSVAGYLAEQVQYVLCSACHIVISSDTRCQEFEALNKNLGIPVHTVWSNTGARLANPANLRKKLRGE